MPDRVGEARLTVHYQGVTSRNVFHFVSRDPVGQNEHLDVEAAIAAWFVTSPPGGPPRPVDFFPHGVGAVGQLLFETGATILSNLPGIGLLGVGIKHFVQFEEALGDVAFAGSAGLWHWKTAYSGRGRSGRSYFGPVPNAYLDGSRDGVLDSNFAAQFRPAFEGLIPWLEAWDRGVNRYRLVLLHSRELRPSDSSSGRWDYVTAGWFRDLRIHAQDRRRPRVGFVVGPPGPA